MDLEAAAHHVCGADVTRAKGLEAGLLVFGVEHRLHLVARGVELLPAAEEPGELEDEHLLVDLTEADGGDGRAIELPRADLADHGRFVALLTVPEKLDGHGAAGAFVDSLLPDLEDLSPRRLGGGKGA